MPDLPPEGDRPGEDGGRSDRGGDRCGVGFGGGVPVGVLACLGVGREEMGVEVEEVNNCPETVYFLTGQCTE